MNKLNLLAVAAGSMLLAQQSFSSELNFYGGLDVGMSTSDYIDDQLGDIAKEIERELNDPDVSFVGKADTSDTAFRLFGGIQLDENWGVQLSYANFGKYTAKFEGYHQGNFVDNESFSFKTHGFYIDGVYTHALQNQKTKLFGELGVGSTELKAEGESDSGFTGHIGAGVRYEVNNNIDLEAGIHRYFVKAEDIYGKEKLGEAQIGFYSIGINYSF